MARTSLHAYKVGDWGRARLMFARLTATAPIVSETMRVEAHLLKGIVQAGLKSGSFAVKYNWAPLSPMTRMLRTNVDGPPLVDSHSYVEAIRVLPMGPRVWSVGVPKNARNSDAELIAEIGLAHELGYTSGSNNWGYPVPRRPFWRSEYQESRKRLYRAVLVVLKAQVTSLGGGTVASLRSMASSAKWGFKG